MKRIWREGYSYFEPPEKPEPKYLEFEEEIEFPLDTIIYIGKDGSWEYEDEEYSWAKPEDDSDEWWLESDEYPEISMEVVDVNRVVECVDDLLEPLLPFGPGKFRITGNVRLTFNISDVEKYSEYEGQDEDGDPVYEEEYITDRAEVEFLFDKSSIEDFECKEV